MNGYALIVYDDLDFIGVRSFETQKQLYLHYVIRLKSPCYCFSPLDNLYSSISYAAQFMVKLTSSRP